MVMAGLGSLARKLFGSANDRRIKGYQPKVAAINGLEAEVKPLSDEELRGRTDKFRAALAAGTPLDDLLAPAFATVREAGRRVLGQNACLLLVSDGLDREAGEGLSEEMERLRMACRHLIWLNPLLRYEKFEAKPAGVRAMLPYVDRFLPVHNLKSLIDLAKVMNQPAQRSRIVH